MIAAFLRSGALAAALFVALPSAARADTQGDAAAGKALFGACAQCHALGDAPAAPSQVGPPLDGVIGRRAASVPGFTYSPQLRSSRIVWDAAYLARFIKAPKSLIPGTRMQFNGLGSDQEVADVIAYLSGFAARETK